MRTSKTIWLLNALILTCASIAIFMDYQKNTWFLLFKPLTTVLVILIPVSVNINDRAFKKWLISALCFCLLGDILLLNPYYFTLGLGAFLIAHLLLARAFIGAEGFQKFPMVGLFLLVVGVLLYNWLYPDLGVLKYPVAAYVLVILFMVWQAVGLLLKKKSIAFGLIALGAFFFMFSDSMIAIDKFMAPFELSGVVILSTYWLAITLIANSVCHLEKT